MKHLIVLARVLLGIGMLVPGALGLLGLLGVGPMASGELPAGDAGLFMGLLLRTKYMAVVKLAELLGGLLILSGRLLPLGLVMVIPVLVNIVTFHVTMDPAGLPPGAVLSVLAAFLLWSFRQHFTGILAVDARPSMDT